MPDNVTTASYRNRDVRLASRSAGVPQPTNVVIAESALPPRGPAEVLVRNRWFRVSISTRFMMSEAAETVKGIPFPPLRIGDALADGAIGEVVEAPEGAGLQPGDLVLHPLGWRDWALVEATRCTRIGRECRDPAAWLGHGWTAYAALTRGIQVRPGDTVFVSSGAGGIGSMAGQIARRLGAARVIGSTGSADKAAWMRADLGYDEVVLRGRGPIAASLRSAAPDGIDVFVDMVGGEQLEAAAAAAREGARFVLLGALTAELNAERSTTHAPAVIDSFALVIRNVTLRGYSADDDPDALPEWVARLEEPGWRDVTLAATVYDGLDAAPTALAETRAGATRGVTIVRL